MGAAWASVAISAASAAYGAKQNSDAKKANSQMANESKEDYAARLRAAGVMAAEFEKQYNELTESRPGLSWESFVRDKIKAINDPFLRQFYTTAKQEDFDRLREFAKAATNDNVSNLEAVADRLSGGKWKETIDKRNELVFNTNAAGRMARSYELAAPVRTAASTVRYDDKGQLIEGQRADKQAFQIATEVQTEIEREQKQDLRHLETDRLSAAQSQVEKARGFMEFFDATGYATAVEADRSKLVHDYQIADEDRAFEIYKMFAAGASDITPTQPTYQNPGAGNALITSGVSGVTSGLSAYSDKQKADKTASSSAARSGTTY